MTTRSLKHVIFLAVALALLSGCAARNAPAPPAQKERLVDRLLRQINDIPMVDSHTHVPLPAGMMEAIKDPKFHYDVPYLIGGSTYVAALIYGSDWPQLKERIAINGQNAYYRPMVLAMRDLYGLGANEELSDSNVEAISHRMDQAHRDPSWYGDVLQRAKVKDILWMDWEGEAKQKLPGNQLPHTTIHPVWNIDSMLVYIAGKYPPGKRVSGWKIDLIQARGGVTLKTLDDMEAMIDKSITKFFADGGVSLKSTSAYFRPLNFSDSIPREKAAAIFAKVAAHEELSDADERLLEDYLMCKVLETANKLKVPFQFHTGNQQNWNIVENSNPLGLNRLLYSGKYSNVKFVILHGGYPYTQQAIMLTKYFPGNVYLDLAWMPLFSPAAAKQTLSQAMDILDGTQLMIGTDTANLEELYGTVKITRRLMAEVCAEKVESGFWTEEIALQAARRVLYTNAVELYGLKK